MQKIFFLITVLIILFSCSDQENSIFYFLENEEEEVDNSLSNIVTINGMGFYNTYYYIAASRYIRRSTGIGARWYVFSGPSSIHSDTALVTSLAVNANTLYAGFLLKNDNFQFWSCNLDTSVWTQLSNVAINGKQISWIKVVNGTVFFATHDEEASSPFQLFTIGFVECNQGAQKTPYQDVAFTGGNYYILLKGSAVLNRDSAIYTGGAINTTAAWANTPTTEELGGIYYDSTGDNAFYITTHEGRIYYSDDGGGTWSDSGKLDVRDNDVRFDRITEVNSNIVIATLNYGIWEIPGSLGVTNLDRMDDFTEDDLYNGMIADIYIDTPNTVFAQTVGAGLWSNTYDGSDWGTWVHE